MSQFELGPRQKQLVAALRSGEYKQGFRSLHNESCFCVEGVACDLSGLGEWEGEYYKIGDRAEGGFMPSEVLRHYRLKCLLFGLNDNDKLSFAEIADLLEAKPEEYFHGPV